MRKFLSTLKLFLFFSAIFYIVFIFLWEMLVPAVFRPNLLYNPDTGMLQEKLEDVKDFSKIDVLFLGSSKAYRTFDPRFYSEVGLTSFNLGSSSQTHIQTNYLLRKYLNKLNPELIVYEVHPEIFSLRGIESSVNIISAVEEIDTDLVEHIFIMNDIKTYNTFLLKLTKSPFNLEGEENIKDKYIPGGFVEGDYQNTPHPPVVDREWMPREDQIKFFEENLQLISQKNIPVLLVFSPFKFKFKNEEEVKKYFSNRGTLLDYNKIIPFNNEEDFYDEHHLNKEGSYKLNKDLARRIKKHYFN